MKAYVIRLNFNVQATLTYYNYLHLIIMLSSFYGAYKWCMWLYEKIIRCYLLKYDIDESIQISSVEPNSTPSINSLQVETNDHDHLIDNNLEVN